MCNTLKELPNKYNSKNLTALSFKMAFSNSLYICFRDEKFVKNIHEDLVIPFHIDSETEVFTVKTDKEIKERIAFEKRKSKVNKLFEKIKSKLRKSGKDWYSLDTINEFDGEWHIWLNPKEQHKYNYGWYTIEDLSDWLNDKGKIMKTIL